MAEFSHNTEMGDSEGSEASPRGILPPPLPCEKDPTVEEIILTRPENLESQAHDAQDSGGSSPHRSR